MSDVSRGRIWLFKGIVVALIVTVTAGMLYAVEALLQWRYVTQQREQARAYPPHPFLQVLADRQTDHVNAAGFRGDPIDVPKAPGTYRIFTMGGSTTLSVQTSYEETYPAQLERLLRRRYPNVRFEVQNAGVAWYATPHMLVEYELRIRQYHPDLVIVFEAINDLYRGFSPSWWATGPFKPDYSHYLGPYIGFLGPDAEAFSQTGHEWLLWRKLKQRFLGEPSPYNHRPENIVKLNARLRPREVSEFPSLASFRDYYRRLVGNLERDGVTVVVASQPFLYREDLGDAERGVLYFPQTFAAEQGTYPDVRSMVAGMRRFNDAARTIAETSGAEFLDFEASIPKTLDYFFDDVHLRAVGNARLAALVDEWIASAPASKQPGR